MLNIDTSNYPIDAQRVYNLFKENKNLLGVNLLYRASHGRVYNVTFQYGDEGLFVSYFAYGYLNKYFHLPFCVVKTYLMFVMDHSPVQESHLINNRWELVHDSSNR